MASFIIAAKPVVLFFLMFERRHWNTTVWEGLKPAKKTRSLAKKTVWDTECFTSLNMFQRFVHPFPLLRMAQNFVHLLVFHPHMAVRMNWFCIPCMVSKGRIFCWDFTDHWSYCNEATKTSDLDPKQHFFQTLWTRLFSNLRNIVKLKKNMLNFWRK